MDEILTYFAALGFEETDIEDGLTALCLEDPATGDYVLLTDDEGIFPDSLNVPLILARYSPENVFLWSVGFKNAAAFKAIWPLGGSFAEKIDQVQTRRDPDPV